MRIFHRLEILFHDFQAMRDKLAFTLQEVAGPGPPELSDLSRLLFCSQRLVQAVRHAPTDGIEPTLNDLRHAIESASRMQETKIAAMKKMDLYHSRDLTGYRYLILHAQEILKIGEEYARNGQQDSAINRYGKSDYYYNRRLLPRYNHAENGMVAYYNSFVRFANTHLIQQVEEVPWFRSLDLPELAKQPEEKHTGELRSDSTEKLHVVNHLVFLLDVSASMNKPEKLPLLKEALKALMESMHEKDRISIVIYSGNARRIIRPASASQSDEVIRAIGVLRPGGMTHFRKGIHIAYQTAEDCFIEGGNNRVILATDGAFRIASSTLRKVQRKSSRDVPLSVFFLGKKMATRTSRQLESLARAGAGNFVHLTAESACEALQGEVDLLRK
jgi:Ca-activated chloride channel family protein